MISLLEIKALSQNDFGSELLSVKQVNQNNIRIELREGFIDIFQSIRDSTKYAFHLKLDDGRVYRLDSRPERKYQKLKSFPWYFHKETERNVVVSPFLQNKKAALTQFLKFAKKVILKAKH